MTMTIMDDSLVLASSVFLVPVFVLSLSFCIPPRSPLDRFLMYACMYQLICIHHPIFIAACLL